MTTLPQKKYESLVEFAEKQCGEVDNWTKDQSHLIRVICLYSPNHDYIDNYDQAVFRVPDEKIEEFTLFANSLGLKVETSRGGRIGGGNGM